MKRFPLLLLVTAIACGGPTERDSRPGSPTEDVEPVPGLQLGGDPVVQIGVLEGPHELMFSRIVGVVRLPDGRIVVADGGSSQLRFFDAAGKFLHSAGRDGQGPGEFEFLFDLRRCAPEYLYAFELPWNANRFTLDGDFIDSFALTTESASPYSFACNANGEFLTISWGVPTRGLGYFGSRGRVELLDAAGAPVADLGEFAVSERHGTEGGSGPHPYGKQTVLGLTTSHAFVGTADSHEILRFALPDQASSSIMVASEAPALDLGADELDRFRDWTLTTSEPRLATWWEEQFKTLEFPSTIPAYTQIVVDQEDAIWLRDFRREWEDVERWRVYSTSGTLIAVLHLPLRFRVHEIGHDYVIGVCTDETGTEYVRLYELTRPNRESDGS